MQSHVILLPGMCLIIRSLCVIPMPYNLLSAAFSVDLPTIPEGRSPTVFAYGFPHTLKTRLILVILSKDSPNKKMGNPIYLDCPSFTVGVPGFEPGTPCSQSRCANRTALHPESFALLFKSGAKIRNSSEIYKQILK